MRMLLGEVEIQNGLQLQLGEKGMKDPKIDEVKDGFKPDFDGHVDYERETPERFSGEKDDQLMKSLINKYAIEGRGEDGKKNGKFYLDKAGATAVSEEVVETHLGLKGDKKDAYIKEHVPDLWSQWDVNDEGHVTADRIPTMLRKLVGDPVAGFGLQMQKEKK